jgi:hypothetical protein
MRASRSVLSSSETIGVSDSGSTSRGRLARAAVRLRLSQPSVSVRIAAVERVVGAELFVRDPRGARLTSAGQRYLHYVRRCLHLLEQGRHAAGQRAGEAIRTAGTSRSCPGSLPRQNCARAGSGPCRSRCLGSRRGSTAFT